MNKPAMTWQLFKEGLLRNPELDLQFQYADNQRVDASYHITEIKQAPIISVDCGGVVNKWTEVIVQLYEPSVKQQIRPMKVRKALSIIDLVEKVVLLNDDGMVKIEFGTAGFDTRQMLPNNIAVDGENLVVDLRPDTVQCKAIDRGESCGTPAKQKVELKNLAAADSCCTPGGGCC